MGYRGYGLPVTELISEGNIGLMQAVKKYDPDKGFRLATYAMWWIRAAIQEYVLKSWSLVKIGTTAAQKKLFFNLKKLKNRLSDYSEGSLKPHQVTEIANQLNVSEKEVSEMEGRISGNDYSLNAVVSADGEEEWQERIEMMSSTIRRNTIQTNNNTNKLAHCAPYYSFHCRRLHLTVFTPQ